MYWLEAPDVNPATQSGRGPPDTEPIREAIDVSPVIQKIGTNSTSIPCYIEGWKKEPCLKSLLSSERVQRGFKANVSGFEFGEAATSSFHRFCRQTLAIAK